MFDVFGDMKRGNYERSLVGSKNLTSKNKVQGSLQSMRGQCSICSLASQLVSTIYSLSPGTVIDTESGIYVDRVPIITPNRDVVVSSLSFNVRIIACIAPDSGFILVFADGRGYAFAHHWSQWLWQELLLPDPQWSLACAWRKAVQTSSFYNVLYSTKVCLSSLFHINTYDGCT
jgi:hypothetical protein